MVRGYWRPIFLDLRTLLAFHQSNVFPSTTASDRRLPQNPVFSLFWAKDQRV
jgi:hypothetical protein